MFTGTHILLTPDESAGNGSGQESANPAPTPNNEGTAGEDKTGSAREKSDTSASSQTGGGKVLSEQEYQTLMRKAQQADGTKNLWNQLQEKGIKDHESLLKRLDNAELVDKLQKQNPHFGDALKSLASADEHAEPDPNQPATAQAVQEMIRNELRQFHSEQQTRQRQAQIKQAYDTQDSTMNEIAAEESYKEIFGGKAFTDALESDDRRVRAAAVLFDDAVASLAQKDQNGKPLPVTDRKLLDQAARQVAEVFGHSPDQGGSDDSGGNRSAENGQQTRGTPYDHKPKRRTLKEVEREAQAHMEADYSARFGG